MAMKFTDDFLLEPVIIEHRSGEVGHYALRELDGDQGDAHLTNMSKRTRYNAQGQPAGISNFRGLQAELIASAMFEAQLEQDPETGNWSVAELGSKVSTKTVQKWPLRIRNALHSKLAKMSGLDAPDIPDKLDDYDYDDEEAAKNRS